MAITGILLLKKTRKTAPGRAKDYHYEKTTRESQQTHANRNVGSQAAKEKRRNETTHGEG